MNGTRSGVDIPREKRVEVALTYVFGIGRTRSKEALAATGDPNTRVRDLAEEDLVKIREYVDAHLRTEGDLRREIRPTSAARSRSAATRVCVTVVGSRSTASAQHERSYPQGPASRDRR